MTFWDFVCQFMDRGGIAWSLLVTVTMSSDEFKNGATKSQDFVNLT